MSKNIPFTALAAYLLFFSFLISCSKPDSSLQTATASSPAGVTPTVALTNTAELDFSTPPATEISKLPDFSIVPIRAPNDTDGNLVLTAFWAEDEGVIYYALVKEYFSAPLWFKSQIKETANISHEQLSSLPQLMYPPSFPAGGVYLEYRGLVSPSGRYYFQIVEADKDSLFLFDSVEQSKVKLLETSDMNFGEGFWLPGENKVVFGVGPEYGVELYLYDRVEKKLSSFAEMLGYIDPNISEWALSPDGKYVAILGGDQGLSLFALDGSFSTVISGDISNIRWAGNSHRIFYYSGLQPDNPTNIDYFDIDSKTAVNLIPLSELEKSGVDGFFDVSPNGSQLVFWQAGNIWLLSVH